MHMFSVLLGQRCARLPQSGRCLSGYRGGREWGDRDSGGRSYGARKQTEEVTMLIAVL